MDLFLQHWAWFISLMHLAGWISAFHVLHTDRNPQATVGWTLALLLISPLAVPFYWTFGARRYKGYRRALQRAMANHDAAIDGIFGPLDDHVADDRETFFGLHSLTPFPLTRYNRIELLIDGAQTFAALFDALSSARDYIVAEYYTISNDRLGREFLSLLERKAREGVRVYLLYDLIGSHAVHRLRARQLRRSGINIRRFRSPRFPASYLHFNFRNHRKICVVDGAIAFLGGLNIGDRYLGRHPRLCPWRDTHMRLEGPAARMLQAVFLADWYWATDEQLTLTWDHVPDEEATGEVAILPTGPADKRNLCTLILLEMIHEANERIWLTTPYLIPTDAIAAALESAASRGVDVRILAPDCADHRVAFYAGWYFAHRLRAAGIRVDRGPGFIHQKVALIDEKLATVGTVNLDPRSLELNFEVTAAMTDADSIDAVKTMLENDFSAAQPTIGEWERLNELQRTTARICRLFSPLL